MLNTQTKHVKRRKSSQTACLTDKNVEAFEYLFINICIVFLVQGTLIEIDYN